MKFEYLHKYGYDGTSGRFNASTARGGFDDEKYVHTAKNETRSWVTPSPTNTPTVTPTATITPTVTPSVSITPSITVSRTPSVTPSTAASLNTFSFRQSQGLDLHTVTGLRYSVGIDVKGWGAATTYEYHPFGNEGTTPFTGNWSKVSYSHNSKSLWVKSEDVATFNSNQHVTGIYSIESIPWNGHPTDTILIIRGSGKGETIFVAELEQTAHPGVGPFLNETDPTAIGSVNGSHRENQFGFDTKWVNPFDNSSLYTDEDTDLGFRTGAVSVLYKNGSSNVTFKYGACYLPWVECCGQACGGKYDP